MRIQYDPTEDAMYIRFSENKYEESEEVQEGIIFDKDAKGALVGLEILKASIRIPNLNTEEFKFELANGKG